MTSMLLNPIDIFQFSWYLIMQLHSGKLICLFLIYFFFLSCWDTTFFWFISYLSQYTSSSLPGPAPIWTLKLEFFKPQSWALFSSCLHFLQNDLLHPLVLNSISMTRVQNYYLSLCLSQLSKCHLHAHSCLRKKTEHFYNFLPLSIVNLPPHITYFASGIAL